MVMRVMVTTSGTSDGDRAKTSYYEYRDALAHVATVYDGEAERHVF